MFAVAHQIDGLRVFLLTTHNVPVGDDLLQAGGALI